MDEQLDCKSGLCTTTTDVQQRTLWASRNDQGTQGMGEDGTKLGAAPWTKRCQFTMIQVKEVSAHHKELK
jgi:hypothetical protein